MQKLEITENKRLDLNNNAIVICSYIKISGGISDCIELEYQTQYPDFKTIDVIQNEQ